jgi:predicted nucleic acid-binding protein
MSIYYLDSSALVKYYVSEPGSTWVTELATSRQATNTDWLHTLLLGEVGIPEVAAALSILARTGKIPTVERQRAYQRLLADANTRFKVVGIISVDYYAAADLTQRHPLKAYDAVQLAMALRQKRVLSEFDLPLTFVSGDRTLLQAAQAEGLLTDDPFEHVVAADSPGR